MLWYLFSAGCVGRGRWRCRALVPAEEWKILHPEPACLLSQRLALRFANTATSTGIGPRFVVWRLTFVLQRPRRVFETDRRDIDRGNPQRMFRRLAANNAGAPRAW